MNFIKTKFDNAWLIEPKVISDNRGFFLESFSSTEFKKRNIDIEFLQDNHSMSLQENTVRGLHFQLPPVAQSKLVRVISGAILDAIVDLRKNSKTYGQHELFALTADNFLQLFVPKGFAHGFCTLLPKTEVVYKVDNYYSSAHDSGLAWNDPDLNIFWPTNNPIVSEKDKKLQTFKDFISPF